MAAQVNFRAGDEVRHRPTGETWVLACDEEDGRVLPCGWPETVARAADCELVAPASDVERELMLLTAARICPPDERRVKARRQLGAEWQAQDARRAGGAR